ncbi:hypothetical protein [Frigidibacter sp. ROC022]|uniref:hypothetical protein n=1 Tax=Frigidibacter sp. ROC022 TaxID=2971796 RepID=UPI00215B34A9|nr:hypothetical protein [Frigidibacter sp. ROC022]MCR8724833.1 hypothetical protein [Frigidibacter sp. ROC022]
MAGIKIGYIDYPVELTDKDWQKKKGLIGKMTKTGIGATLKKAQALHGKIDFAKLDPAAENPRNKADLAKGKKAAEAYYKKYVVPFSASLKTVEETAKKAIKQNAKMPKKSLKAMEDIAKIASTLQVTMKSFDLEAAVNEALERIERRQKLAAKYLNDSLKKFVTGAAAFMKDPTPESWLTNIKQQGRSVSNSVKELTDYNARFWKDFEKFKGFDLGTLKLETKDPKFAQKSTAIVKLALAQVKQIAAFKP